MGLGGGAGTPGAQVGSFLIVEILDWPCGGLEPELTRRLLGKPEVPREAVGVGSWGCRSAVKCGKGGSTTEQSRRRPVAVAVALAYIPGLDSVLRYALGFRARLSGARGRRGTGKAAGECRLTRAWGRGWVTFACPAEINRRVPFTLTPRVLSRYPPLSPTLEGGRVCTSPQEGRQTRPAFIGYTSWAEKGRGGGEISKPPA